MAKTRKKTTEEPLPDPTLETAAPQSVGDTMAADDGRDRIAARAYELYLARGGGDGDPINDWLTAERELSNNRTDE